MAGLRVLIIGSGGREHALAWRLAGEPEVDAVVVAPGNPLIAGIARVVPEVAAADADALAALARRERIDLVVVGPEAPLVAGFADRLVAEGVAVCGQIGRAHV